VGEERGGTQLGSGNKDQGGSPLKKASSSFARYRLVKMTGQKTSTVVVFQGITTRNVISKKPYKCTQQSRVSNRKGVMATKRQEVHTAGTRKEGISCGKPQEGMREMVFCFKGPLIRCG
jgi:hypothetical protein